MNFFGGEFFGGGFFGETTTTRPRPDDGPGRKKLRLPKKGIYKPTGLPPFAERGEKATVDARTEQSQSDAIEIARKLALDFATENATLRTREPAPAIADFAPIEQMSLAEIEFEIGVLLRKKLQREEEIMLLLMVAASVH